MSKQLHKKPQKIEKLSPGEEAVAKRVLSGKEEIYELKRIEDLNKPLSELEPCGKSTIRKLFTSKD